MPPNDSLPSHRSLSDVSPGEAVVIDRLSGGRDFAFRVAGLGFTIGAQVQVVQNYGRGPIIVNVRGAHLALGRQEALQIQVRLV
jgi:ferrous iron transport protein A